jgi:hypothetical protein
VIQIVIVVTFMLDDGICQLGARDFNPSVDIRVDLPKGFKVDRTLIRLRLSGLLLGHLFH